MLDQMVRDYTNTSPTRRTAIAGPSATCGLLEEDHREDVEAPREWGDKALAASRKADELRAAGDASGADKFDNLAKVALQRQISSENEARAAEPQIAAQTEVVDKLKAGLDGMKEKLVQLQTSATSWSHERRPHRRRTGARRGEDHRHPRPDERARPLRGEDPPRGGDGERASRARRVEPRRAVQRARRPRRATAVETRLAALKAGGSAQGAVRADARSTDAASRPRAAASASHRPTTDRGTRTQSERHGGTVPA